MNTNHPLAPFTATLLTACLMFAASGPAPAQDKSPTDAPAHTPQSVETSPSISPPPAPQFTLADGTVVKLRLVRDLLSAKEQDEETIQFEVIEEVKVGEVVVIQKGAAAEGTVIEAKAGRRMGRSGKLAVRLDYVFLASGKRAPLRAMHSGVGGSRAGTVGMGVAVSAMYFFPAAPLFLLVKGKDVTIPKGTLVTSFVDGDVTLNPADFAAKPAEK
jgi:glucose/arabinose dehydrogenase